MGIKVNMDAYNREQADLEICILAFGTVRGSREFFLPRGEMACDAFDQAVEEAWERLTPNQQAAIMDGRFSITVPTARHMGDSIYRLTSTEDE
jgi:hypothetical protein